jgi:trk system potassium uptake protein TrkA
MRIAIVGGGEVGFALAQALAPDHEVFAVDHAPAVADRFEPLDVQFVLGSATSAETLQRAGVERADFLVACTGLDEVNILACAVARQLGSPRTVCFVSREDFLQIPEGPAGLGRFGVDRLLWPEAQLAADIERIVVAPGAIDAEEFAGGAIRLLEYRLDATSPLVGCHLADVHLPHGVLVVAVRRDEGLFIPRGDTQLLAGDKAILMGTPDGMTGVHERLQIHAELRQRVTIIGGGDVGLRLAERLDTAPNVELLVIESSESRGEMLAARLKRALVLHGDGTDLELLETEDIGRSDVLVSVIDNDEKNLLASLLGRQLGVRRVITRVGKRANLRLFERVGIDVAISARGAAVASVLHQIEGGAASLLAVLEQGAGRVLELEVPPNYAPRALKDMSPPRESIVGAILRNGRAIVPRGGDRVEPGDHLLVFCTEDAVDVVRGYFTSPR